MMDDTILYRDALDHLYDGVYFLDRQRKIFFWNKGAERITGYRSQDVMGRSCADNILCHVDRQGRSLCREGCPAACVMEDGQGREAEVYLLHKDGYRKPVRIRVAPIEDTPGHIVGAMEIFSDDTSPESLRRRVALLEKLSALDPLTQLPNRRSMEAAMASRLAEIRRYHVTFGVLFIDIDHFKSINDRYGHETGDEVLKTVAQTLNRSLRPFDLAGRWGGEEFLVLILNVDEAYLEVVAERIRALISQTRVPLKSDYLQVTVSIGGTAARPDDTPETVLNRVDRLMYQSKMDGRNRVSLETD